MSRTEKIWLIVAASLTLAGAIIFGGVMMSGKWGFRDLFNSELEKTDFQIGESFSHISVENSTADIRVLPSEGDGVTVKCVNKKYVEYSCKVDADTLYITAEDTRAWYEHISFMEFSGSVVTIYLPVAEYGELTVKNATGDVEISKDFTFKSIDVSLSTGDVKCGASVKEKLGIKTATGEITVSGVTAENAELSATTGKIRATDLTCKGDIKLSVDSGKCILENISCKNFSSTGDTGDISVKRLTSDGKVRITRNTGDVNFESWNAKDVEIKTSTGDVKGSFVSDMVIFASSDTGRVSVPKFTTGGQCDIITGTGNIIIEIE